MKKMNFIGACWCMSVLAACQQNELLTNGDVEDLALDLQASVFQGNVMSRTVTQENGTSDFREGDAVGFFMPDEESQIRWTLESGEWKSGQAVNWKDKVNEYTFCAYYPYSESAASRSSVPMPDLSAQTGNLADIGAFDFLVARTTTSYEAKSGVVSFTGETAFRHVYALVSVTVKKDLEKESVALDEMTFEGTGLFSSHVYKFGEEAAQDGMQAADEPEKSRLVLSYEEPVAVESAGYTAVVLLNPVELEESLRFTMGYRRDGISYTASTTAMGDTFEGGKFYKYTLKLTKEGLKLVGNTISGWDSQTLPEISVEENPAEQ